MTSSTKTPTLDSPTMTTTATTNNNNTVDVHQASQVERAVTNAISLVQQFSEQDPHDDTNPNNPWKDPQAMLVQLDQARNKIAAAWQQADANTITILDDEGNGPTSNSNNNSTPRNFDNTRVRAAYMDMVTEAFADVLEDMRTNSNRDNSKDTTTVGGVQAEQEEEFDLDVLVDCLQSGMDFMSGEEQDIFMMDQDDDGDDDDGDGDDDRKTTPHEQRRMQLGLHV